MLYHTGRMIHHMYCRMATSHTVRMVSTSHVVRLMALHRPPPVPGYAIHIITTAAAWTLHALPVSVRCHTSVMTLCRNR